MLARAPEQLLRKLEWRVRGAADTVLGGEYRSSFRGRGRDFDQVVKYEYGDDVRDIDWNVTARLGEPYRKKFVEERELTVALLFQDSLSLQFGSGRRSKRDALLEVAGLFALLSAGHRDRVGFWHAAPGNQRLAPPVRGRTAVLETAKRLFSEPTPALDGDVEVDVDWERFRHAFPSGSVVIWLGDFPPGVAPPAWSALRARYELLGVRVDDPWERELPDTGLLEVVDLSSGELLPFDCASSANRRRHARWVEEREAGWSELFPAPFERLAVSTEDDLLDALVRFFRARMRMVRR